MGQNLTYLQKELKKASSDTARVRLLNRLTETYWGNKSDSSVMFNQQSLSISRAKKLYNFDGLCNSAIIERKKGNTDGALEIIKKAYHVAVASGKIKDQSKAQYLSGVIYESKRDYKRALEYGLKSLRIREQYTDTNDLISSLSAVGSVYKKSFRVTEGLTHFLKAARLAEKSDNSMAAFGIYINLGTLYELSKDDNKAIEFYKKALAINNRDKDKHGYAICYTKFGALYNRQKKYDSAMIYLQKTLQLQIEQNDSLGLMYTYDKIGGVYSEQKIVREARKNAELSNQLAVKYKDTLVLFANQTFFGRLFVMEGKYDAAIKCFQTAFNKYGKRISPETLESQYKILSDAYAQTNDYKNAYLYRKIYEALMDSVRAGNDIKKQTELKLSYEFDQVQDKQKQEALAKEIENELKLKGERQQRYYLLAFLLLACIVIVIAIRSYISKRKANFILEKQNIQIEFQKKLVEEKNKEISDSINYANHIQTACLPDEEQLNDCFEDYFLLFKPRDVVSGDFFWSAKMEDKVLIAVADCTGHGVPGAIMSMIGSILLNEIFYVKKMCSPELMLQELNRIVKLTLKQDRNFKAQDGMDLALCVWDKTTNVLLYAGANRPLYLLRKTTMELEEFKATKLPVGGNTDLVQDYVLNKIQLCKDDRVVLTSDGYADQFGGDKMKKITTKTFKSMLKKSHDTSSTEQKEMLDDFFTKWKAKHEQTDDVLVFSFKCV